MRLSGFNTFRISIIYHNKVPFAMFLLWKDGEKECIMYLACMMGGVPYAVDRSRVS